jgi:Protein of unknown function (DUF2567)
VRRAAADRGFTEGMSLPSHDDPVVALPPDAGPAPASDGSAVSPARRPWSAWTEMRTDLRPAALVLAVLVVTGVPVGLLWWVLAPRADFRITADGPKAIGNPPDELLAADDVIFVLLVAGVGVLAGVLAWSLLRRHRGVAMLVALALGSGAAAVIAWQLGELLGPGPSKAALSDVGARVTTSLTLHSLPALAVGPFFAVLTYLLATLFTGRDDLGRPTAPPAPAAGPAALGAPALRPLPDGPGPVS